MLVCLDEPVKRSSRNFWMKLKRAHFVTAAAAAAAASQTAARSSKRVHYKNVFWLLKNCFVYLRRDIVHWIKLASCSIKSLATFFANSCFLTKKTCLFILVTRLPRLHLCFIFAWCLIQQNPGGSEGCIDCQACLHRLSGETHLASKFS